MNTAEALQALAQQLATPEGKDTYRETYNEYLPNWQQEMRGTDNWQHNARRNAREDGIAAVLATIGADPDTVDRITEYAGEIDARKWMRTTDPDRIYSYLADVYSHLTN